MSLVGEKYNDQLKGRSLLMKNQKFLIIAMGVFIVILIAGMITVLLTDYGALEISAKLGLMITIMVSGLATMILSIVLTLARQKKFD